MLTTLAPLKLKLDVQPIQAISQREQVERLWSTLAPVEPVQDLSKVIWLGDRILVVREDEINPSLKVQPGASLPAAVLGLSGSWFGEDEIPGELNKLSLKNILKH